MNTAIKTFLEYLIFYGLKNNLVVCNSSGALIFQREKIYTKYRYLSALFISIGIIIGAVISYLMSRVSISSKNLDLTNITTTLCIITVGGYNMLVSMIFKKSKKFHNYLYQNSFSYAYDMVFTLSVIFSLETSLPITLFGMSLLAAIISVFVTTAIIGFFVRNLNRDYINESLRNTSVRLFMFAFFALIFYYLAQMNIVLI